MGDFRTNVPDLMVKCGALGIVIFDGQVYNKIKKQTDIFRLQINIVVR